MNYLLDICVISEIIKTKPDQKVVSWLMEQHENDLYLSVLTLGEIEKGIEKLPVGEKRSHLKLWVEGDLKKRFAGRILTVDMRTAARWGELQGKAEL